MNLPFSLFPFLHRFPSISCVYFSVVLADILTYLIKIWETDIFTGSRQASFWRFPHEEVKNTHTQIPGSWDTQTHECLCDNDELAWYFNTHHWKKHVICTPPPPLTAKHATDRLYTPPAFSSWWIATVYSFMWHSDLTHSYRADLASDQKTVKSAVTDECR